MSGRNPVQSIEVGAIEKTLRVQMRSHRNDIQFAYDTLGIMRDEWQQYVRCPVMKRSPFLFRGDLPEPQLKKQVKELFTGDAFTRHGEELRVGTQCELFQRMA